LQPGGHRFDPGQLHQKAGVGLGVSVSPKISTILFWALMVFAVVALWRIVAEDPKGSLRIVAFVVPFVWFLSWLRNRFPVPKRRMGAILINSVLGALLAGSVLFWDWELFQSGYHERKNALEATIAGTILVACSPVSVWSFLRLRKNVDKVPT
jgi:hypothetical protein